MADSPTEFGVGEQVDGLLRFSDGPVAVERTVSDADTDTNTNTDRTR